MSEAAKKAEAAAKPKNEPHPNYAVLSEISGAETAAPKK